MAKAREVERWITVNGNKVPIYKDGGMGGIMSGKSQKHKEWHKESNKGDVDLSDKKPGQQMTVDYNDIDESPEEFKKRAEEEGFKIIGEGGHSVIIEKADEYDADDLKATKERMIAEDKERGKEIKEKMEQTLAERPGYELTNTAKKTGQEGNYKMFGDERDNSYPSEQEMRDTLKKAGKEKFVKELSGGTERGYQAALRKVYDEHTLSEDEYKKKYYGDEGKHASDKRIASNADGYFIDKEPSGMGDHYSLYYQHPNSGSDGLKFLGDAYGSIDKLESKLGQSVLSNKGVQDVLNQARGGNKESDYIISQNSEGQD